MTAAIMEEEEEEDTKVGSKSTWQPRITVCVAGSMKLVCCFTRAERPLRRNDY